MEVWNFPGNGNGQIRGLADAGIETFTGDEIKSLARETCQNSLDAIRDGEETVIVMFTRTEINKSQIPGFDHYRSNLIKCREYWKKAHSQKTEIFLEQAIDAITSERSYVLSVSDYHTKGLLGPYDNRFDGWNTLTKIDGGATKSGDKAGSFGIGKNAPFCNSYYRMVFYRTLNEENEVAAQGISRLLSFPTNTQNEVDTMTTGIGYFGNKDRNLPVETISELEQISKRNEYGTDVFIFGFRSKYSWVDEMICEVLDNFFVSIMSKKLEVKIKNETIDYLRIGRYINQFKTSCKNTYNNYLVLTSSESQTYVKKFHGLGTLRLKILVDPTEKMNKKILVVRKSGMKLFHLGNISRVVSFSGILDLEGKELNEYFREMESPAHDSWKPSRHTNPQQAKEYYEELKDWVHGIVLSQGEFSSDESMDIEGLGPLLQNNTNHGKSEEVNDEKAESLNNNIRNIRFEERSPSRSTRGFFYGNNGNLSNSSDKSTKTGIISESGDKSAVRTLKGKQSRNKLKDHKGFESGKGDDIVHESKHNSESCALSSVRIIHVSGGYRVSFSVPHHVENGYIEIVTVGENGRTNILSVSKASSLSLCDKIWTSDNKIYFENMDDKGKVKIDFSLHCNRDYAMEVNVYETN